MVFYKKKFFFFNFVVNHDEHPKMVTHLNRSVLCTSKVKKSGRAGPGRAGRCISRKNRCIHDCILPFFDEFLKSRLPTHSQQLAPPKVGDQLEQSTDQLRETHDIFVLSPVNSPLIYYARDPRLDRSLSQFEALHTKLEIYVR